MISPRKAAYPRRRAFPAPAPAGGGLRAGLEAVLARYEEARARDGFSRAHPLLDTFRQLQGELARLPSVASRPTLETDWSAGVSRWARVPWAALLDTRETRSTQRGVHAAYLFREDGTGVYLVLTQGIAEPRRQLGGAVARSTLRQRAADLRAYGKDLPAHGFHLDDLIDLRSADSAVGRDAEAAVIAYKLYEAGAVPPDEALSADLEALLAAYDRYLRARRSRTIAPAAPQLREPRARHAAAEWRPEQAVGEVIEYVEARGFVFEPWQIAAYLTALRTKPFVILAGVSGIGKSRLPALVAEATGGHARLVPVRPDWTDSAETLGYTDLAGAFRPGSVLRVAAEAADHPARQYVCVLDEMNLARPEHFFAEVLSRIEDRRPHPAGGFASAPLVDAAPDEWSAVGLPPNLALVGTVNMDESAHGFSRKVLDRAFTLELSDVELARWESSALPSGAPAARPWPMRAWHPRAIALGGLGPLSADDRARVQSAVDAVGAVNPHLAPAGLQAGYRTRDEMALFVLHAAEVAAAFADGSGARVDPLDLALHMKILPRIAGGSGPVRRAVLGLLGWAHDGRPLRADSEARPLLDAWDAAGRPGALPGARHPRTAARLCMMWERMLAEGFTSFWA